MKTILACIVLLVSWAGDASAQQTVLWLQSDVGDYIGQAQTSIYSSPAFSFNATQNYSHGVSLDVAGWYLDLGSATNTQLVPGAYEQAARFAFKGGSPGLDFSGQGRGCNMVAGRFVVYEVAMNGVGGVQTFAADFEQHCEGFAAALWGEVRINSTVPLLVDKPAGTTMPGPMAFAGQVLLAPNTVLTSNSSTVYGINAPAPISVTGGEYSVNDGPFVSSSGTVSNRDHVRVRQTTSSSAGVTTTATLNVGGLGVPFNATTFQPGVPINALWTRSFPGDAVGEGQTQYVHEPDWTFNFSHGSPDTAQINVNGPGGAQWRLSFAAAQGATLAVGPYENAAPASFRGNSAGLEVDSPRRGCYQPTGRFVVLEADYNLGSPRFAANFEQWCDSSLAPIVGEVRINSAVPLNFLVSAPDVTPDPMAFISQILVLPNTPVTSNASTVYGINAAVPISVSGGTYSLNGGVFVSTPGMVNNLDQVRVQQTSSLFGGNTTTATLNVGGMSVPFTVTTIQSGAPLTALYFKSYQGDYIGGGQTLFAHSPDWTIAFQRNASDRVQVNLNGPAGGRWTLNLASSLGASLSVGAYEEAVRWPFQGSSPAMDFSGNGGGCNMLLGRFSVLEADYSNPSAPHFAADFEQWCDGSSAPLLGEVRIDSTIPLSFVVTDPDSTPDPMALSAQSPVKAGSTVYSNWTRVYGINVGVPISISGPANFSINGGEFSAATRTAHNLDLIEASMQASSTPGATAQSILTVGSLSIPFSVTTYQPGQPLTGLYFRSSMGDYVGAGDTRTYLAPYNGLTTQPYGTGLQFSVTGLEGDWWYLIMTPPVGGMLTTGIYENALGIGWGSPSLDFFGNGRGCNQIAGRFVVYEAAYKPDGSIDRFSADFEQHCEIFMPPLYGEIRYNATKPFSFLSSALLSTASRKSHGFFGAFDLELTMAAIDGPITVEPRVIGSGHAIVFRFEAPISSPGTATCVNAFGYSVGTISSVTASGNDVIVNLAGIPDNQRVTVTLSNVNGGLSGSVSLGFLVGDVSSSKTVTASDILRIKGKQGSIDSSNFRYDVDLSGGVSPGDLQAAKDRSGLSMP